MFGLLGRNGAGKTTLMKTLTTLLAPKGGSVTVCGVPVSQSLRVREMTGYLPQEFSMYPSMTVYEALDYLSVLSGMPKQLRQKRIPELLLKVNLSDRGGTKVKALSGGMKRRLGIAQAIMEDPPLLLLDEPMNGLDNQGVSDVRELLARLREEGKTIILASHSKEDIDILCDTVCELDHGRLIHSRAAE